MSMGARELKVGLIMIERQSLFECLCAVALFAGF